MHWEERKATGDQNNAKTVEHVSEKSVIDSNYLREYWYRICEAFIINVLPFLSVTFSLCSNVFLFPRKENSPFWFQDTLYCFKFKKSPNILELPMSGNKVYKGSGAELWLQCNTTSVLPVDLYKNRYHAVEVAERSTGSLTIYRFSYFSHRTRNYWRNIFTSSNIYCSLPFKIDYSL